MDVEMFKRLQEIADECFKNDHDALRGMFVKRFSVAGEPVADAPTPAPAEGEEKEKHGDL